MCVPCSILCLKRMLKERVLALVATNRNALLADSFLCTSMYVYRVI